MQISVTSIIDDVKLIADQFEQCGLYGFTVFTTVMKLTEVDFLGQFNLKAH